MAHQDQGLIFFQERIFSSEDRDDFFQIFRRGQKRGAEANGRKLIPESQGVRRHPVVFDAVQDMGRLDADVGNAVPSHVLQGLCDGGNMFTGGA